jgi:hypothetical protein
VHHNINISMLVYDLVDSRSEVIYTGGGTTSSVEKGGAWAGGLVEHAEIDVFLV